jgi:Mg2+ and Co2+ transporter CorA
MEIGGFQKAFKKLHTWRRVIPQYRRMLTETLQQWFDGPDHTNSSNSNYNTAAGRTETSNRLLHDATHLNELRDDFSRIFANMEDYQRRVEGLTSVITAIISISSDEQARKENQSITRRLIALAIVFVPLSFISGLFSMQTDISQLRGSIKWYFIISASFFGACTLLLGLVHLIRWGIAQRV